MEKVVAMIPARMGSQRLARKNLREINGVPLIVRAVRKCIAAGCFDEIWVNSEDEAFGEITASEGAKFYQRPKQLGTNEATSEDFVTDFLQNVRCDRIVQVHSIAPLLTALEVRTFVAEWIGGDCDVFLSFIPDQIEVAFQGQPINFTFSRKTNSQELTPVQRITWSVTGWRRSTFLAARDEGRTATYAGRVGFFPVNAVSGHVIKTEEDLRVAEALYKVLRLEGNE